MLSFKNVFQVLEFGGKNNHILYRETETEVMKSQLRW